MPQQFNEVEYNNSKYSSRITKISNNNILKNIGNATLTGYDTYTETTYNKKAELYSIKDIEEKLKQDKQPKNSDYIENIIKKFLDFKNPSKQILMELIKKVEIMDNKQIKVYLNFNIDCEE